jgi:hypothetical protein
MVGYRIRIYRHGPSVAVGATADGITKRFSLPENDASEALVRILAGSLRKTAKAQWIDVLVVAAASWPLSSMPQSETNDRRASKAILVILHLRICSGSRSWEWSSNGPSGYSHGHAGSAKDIGDEEHEPIYRLSYLPACRCRVSCTLGSTTWV